MWSGVPVIGNFSPSSINVPQLGSQTINFTVSDELGHPLASGTTINVSGGASPWPVNVYFGLNNSITIGDVIFPGPGATNFSFVVSDAADTLALSSVNIQISVAGPNGTAYSGVGGISH